jgi:hypothetical protein
MVGLRDVVDPTRREQRQLLVAVDIDHGSLPERLL